jgi:hypothetical protein
MVINPDDINRRFVYHAPNEGTRELHDRTRALFLDFTRALVASVDAESSRETSLMLTSLEEASFWLHAHIARNR